MLKQRVLTAVLLAPPAIAGVLWLPTPWLALGLGVIFLGALFEWSRLIGLGPRLGQPLLLAINAAAMSTLWLWRGHALLPLAALAGVAWWPLAALWLRHYGFGAAGTRRDLLLKATAGSFVVVPAWAAAVMLHALPQHGPWWMLFAIALVWCADTAAYFAGRRFGRAKLAPRISPGKTLAGLYGALAASAVYAAAGGYGLGHTGRALLLLVALSLVAVAVSVVGDLFESLMKRHSNMKDSGDVFPGHGGVLDRLDSLFAALPVFAAGKWWLAL
jgi:phosphatidate cytidylyltransferase